MKEFGLVKESGLGLALARRKLRRNLERIPKSFLIHPCLEVKWSDYKSNPLELFGLVKELGLVLVMVLVKKLVKELGLVLVMVLVKE